MNKILDLSDYTPEQIADTINSLWVGEYDDCNRKDYFCGVESILDYVLNKENVDRLYSVSSIIEVYCGKKHKAEKVRKIMNDKGFQVFESPLNKQIQCEDYYIAFIGKPAI